MAERFDPYHAKAGSPQGGQFSSSSGGSGSGAKAPSGHAPAPAASGGHGERQRLLAQAHADLAQARKLEAELHLLEKQHKAASASAKKSAASAAAAKKAGHVVHHHHHASQHRHHAHHARTLAQQITSLRTRIHDLRQKAAALEHQASAMRAADMVTNPGGTERLHEYWVHGEGAAKIAWNTPGDFDRCVLHLGKFIADPQGYCNLAHKAATGMYPAQHAADIRKAAGRSAVTQPDYDADGLDSSWDDCSDLPDLAGLDVHHLETAAQELGLAGPDEPAQRAAPKLGTGARFAKLKSSLAAKGAKNPGALAAYIGRKKFGKAKFHKLAAKARGKGGSNRMDGSRAEYMRLYPLEDMHIIRSADGGDGRTVEAFAAVFGQDAEIADHEGHYLEVIDPGAFNRAIDHASRARGGFPGSVKVLYNHGMTIQGTPSERFSMPIGTPVEIRAEARGLLTRTRYSETPLADEVLESIRSGSITSQSFTGRIMRSDPQLRRGDRYRPGSDGSLRTVRRTELGLREYGPVLWPAYSGAEILGVRMSTPGSLSLDPDEFEEINPGTSFSEEPAAGDPLPEEEHSARYHQHALYVLRAKEAREKAGLAW